MFKLGVYPKVISEIINHIPTIAFKTVSWREFLGASSKMVKHYAQNKIDLRLYDQLQSLLPENIAFTTKVHEGAIDKKLAHNILKIYFLQFQNPSGLFLDLRASHFEQIGDKTHWKPNALYHQFSESFRRSILKLYYGYYNEDDTAFFEAMSEIGLTQGLNQNKKQQLKELFFSHFGDSENTVFKLDKFNTSFFKIFEFLMENKIQLQTDFIFLGAYLVTLYMHLEKYDEAINVKDIYREVFIEHLQGHQLYH